MPFLPDSVLGCFVLTASRFAFLLPQILVRRLALSEAEGPVRAGEDTCLTFLRNPDGPQNPSRCLSVLLFPQHLHIPFLQLCFLFPGFGHI